MNVDFSDIQSHVLLGFRESQQALVFFRIEDPMAFRARLAWLEALLTWTDTALPQRLTDTEQGSKVALAFAFRGLQKLLPSRDLLWLEQTPYEYRRTYVGTRSALSEDCYARANGLLLDALEDVETWLVGGKNSASDGVFVLGEQNTADITAGVNRLSAALAHAATIFHVEFGQRAAREHFGFVDGISHPSVDVVDSNQVASLPVSSNPLLHYGADKLLLSQTCPQFPDMPLWLEHASYLVFRRLRQDVPGFHQAIAQVANTTGRTISEITTGIMGRSLNGDSPMASPSPIQPPTDNFDYSNDPNGVICPFSAHTRKANPRSTHPKQIRPIFRRSINYGPSSASTFDAPLPEAERVDRGMLFMCYQASIERQFEYITRHWLNNHEPFRAPVDAMLGKVAGAPGVRDVDIGGTLVSLENFVHATGGGYFLAPTRRALRKVLELP